MVYLLRKQTENKLGRFKNPLIVNPRSITQTILQTQVYIKNVSVTFPNQKDNEYDQEIPQSHTADQPTEP